MPAVNTLEAELAQTEEDNSAYSHEKATPLAAAGRCDLHASDVKM